uniref:Uncharacterized protein n=1 Tax=Nelumbo nucifera TaxID=4432 RepID=A0A822XIS6_NELNU|nr:TPA_asm: hypothetical protein HUJ06_021066 [Nelumbo nucifera]
MIPKSPSTIRKLQLLSDSTSGGDNSIDQDGLRVSENLERISREINLVHSFGEDFGVESKGLVSIVIHELHSKNPFKEIGEVLCIGGGSELTYRCYVISHSSFKEDGFELGLRGIDGKSAMGPLQMMLARDYPWVWGLIQLNLLGS